ncbi:MAG: hypothetical protein V9E83_11260 [Baekduia sp.]
MLRATIALLTATASVAGVAVPAAGAKKKAAAPLTATVNGTFTIKAEVEGGFGNDGGPNWQNVSYELKDVKIPFAKGVTTYASAKVKVRMKYEAMAHTDDRSWHAGCDSEDRHSYSSYTGDVTVGVKETNWLQTNGKSKKYLGWTVTPSLPDDPIVVSSGYYQDWESILMETCVNYGVNTPLGGWSVGFAQPDGVGKLNSERKSVLITAIDTDLGQTGTATGTIKFNKTLPR